MDENKYCKNCNATIPMVRFKRKNGTLINYHSKKCLLCNPHKEGSYLARMHAVQCMKKYQDRIRILYECNCTVGKKDLHHHSYKTPFDVMKLCRKCHMTEHNRLEPGYNSNNKYGTFTNSLKIKKRFKNP